MFLKSVFTAAMLLLATAPMSQQAEAKTRVHIGIGFGDPFFYDRCPYGWPDFRCDYGRRHFYDDEFGPRFRYYHRPYRFHRYVDKMSCTQARHTLRGLGYGQISTRDCSGKFYSFNATRKGRAYRVNVNAYSGEINRTRR
jgi:hypothetical protein